MNLVNKDNNNVSAGIGGLASSHHPDTAVGEANNETAFVKTEQPQAQQSQLQAQSSASPVHSNAPLLSVLRRDSSASTPTLQFESASGLLDDLEDSDDDMPRSGEKRSGRRKIKIEYIEDKSRRHITFSKRKAGIMKKAYELSTLTGTQVLLLVASETGHVYTFATPKLQPLITKQEGKNLIQACLNSPDHHSVSMGDYLPTAASASHHHYENDLAEEDLAPRSASTVATSVQSTHVGYLPSGTTPTPPNGSSAASVAAAAAQVFMNSSHPSQYAAAYQPATNSGPYWNGAGATGPAGAMFAPLPSKSNVQQQSSSSASSQQQQQQQQMYHALLQQQQLYQQYQQQHQQHQMNKSSNDPSE